MAKGTFFKDFKAFITKGNILDMAVGVVIGGAFGKIVSSLVADIITPLITLATGGVSFVEKFVVLTTPPELKGAPVPLTATEAKAAGYGILTYGNFIQTILDFLIIALCIFVMLRVIVKAKTMADKKKLEAEAKAKAEAEAKAKEEAEAAAAKQAALEEATLKEVELLEEIKSILEKK